MLARHAQCFPRECEGVFTTTFAVGLASDAQFSMNRIEEADAGHEIVLPVARDQRQGQGFDATCAGLVAVALVKSSAPGR